MELFVSCFKMNLQIPNFEMMEYRNPTGNKISRVHPVLLTHGSLFGQSIFTHNNVRYPYLQDFYELTSDSGDVSKVIINEFANLGPNGTLYTGESSNIFTDIDTQLRTIHECLNSTKDYHIIVDREDINLGNGFIDSAINLKRYAGMNKLYIPDKKLDNTLDILEFLDKNPKIAISLKEYLTRIKKL